MYSSKITLFNYYESATTRDAYWYPHVLSDVDLITDKGAILKKYGPDATDSSQLHIWKILSHSRTNHSSGRVSGLAER